MIYFILSKDDSKVLVEIGTKQVGLNFLKNKYNLDSNFKLIAIKKGGELEKQRLVNLFYNFNLKETLEFIQFNYGFIYGEVHCIVNYLNNLNTLSNRYVKPSTNEIVKNRKLKRFEVSELVIKYYYHYHEYIPES